MPLRSRGRGKNLVVIAMVVLRVLLGCAALVFLLGTIWPGEFQSATHSVCGLAVSVSCGVLSVAPWRTAPGSHSTSLLYLFGSVGVFAAVGFAAEALIAGHDPDWGAAFGGIASLLLIISCLFISRLSAGSLNRRSSAN